MSVSCLSRPGRPVAPALRRLVPGLLACALLAVAGSALASLDLLARHGLSALTLALVLGMLAGNLLPAPVLAPCGPGIGLAKQRILRLGVVLYGLRLTVQDIGHVGWAGVLVDAAVVCSTFALACGLGIRWLGLDRKTAMLVGIGSAICGAAAVVAAEPVVKARAEQVTVAVATVVVFGTLATFLYPLLFSAGAHLGLLPAQGQGFGLYVGSTVHEVAQVIAAARAVSPEAADTAVIAKMVRVMMLAPFLLALSAVFQRGGGADRARPTVPWFAFAFIGVVLLNSLHALPARWTADIVALDTGLLAMAMAALGLATQLRTMREAGSRPLLLAALLFAWLVVGGAALNAWIPALLD